MILKTFNQTEDKHRCEKIDGKAHHIAMNNNKNFFCAYCFSPLKLSQIAEKYQKEIKSIIKEHGNR